MLDPVHSPSLRGSSWNIVAAVGIEKADVRTRPSKSDDVSIPLDIITALVRQTDGQKWYNNITLCMLCMLTRILQYSKFLTTCRRAAAKICLCPGLQLKRAPATLSEAGRAGPDQPIRAIQPAAHAARRPDVLYATDVRQTSESIIA